MPATESTAVLDAYTPLYAVEEDHEARLGYRMNISKKRLTRFVKVSDCSQ